MAFCVNCGAQIPEGAAFCTSCGSPAQAAPAQAQQPAQQSQQTQPQYQQQPYQQQQQAYQQPAQQPYQQQYQQPYQQPYQQQPGQYAAAGAPKPEYQKLGGWLLVLVVLEGLSVLSYISMLIQSFGSFGSLSSYGGAYLVVGIISILANALGLAYAAGFVYFVVKRNPIFLWFYQVMGLASMALALINVIVSATMVSGSGYGGAAIGGGVAGVVIGILFLALFTMYFCKSVRVRTYMGSTEYIDRALFKIGA